MPFIVWNLLIRYDFEINGVYQKKTTIIFRRSNFQENFPSCSFKKLSLLWFNMNIGFIYLKEKIYQCMVSFNKHAVHYQWLLWLSKHEWVRFLWNASGWYIHPNEQIMITFHQTHNITDVALIFFPIAKKKRFCSVWKTIFYILILDTFHMFQVWLGNTGTS